jgi:glycosyltransferase involved in cell wall biosynthesis
VVKRYPRFSETFIVNEILAHEAAGLHVELFALLPSCDTHFQDALARVRAPVHYLSPENPKASDFWARLQEAAAVLPGFWENLSRSAGAETRDVFQAVSLALAVRRRGIDHLHAHFASSPTAVARLASRVAGIAYSFTAHAKDIYHDAVEPDDLRRKLADAAAVVTVSDYNVEHLRQTYGADASRVRRIYNGMDLDELRYESPQVRQPLIVGVGRLVQKKGFADLIDACGLLAGRGASFRCVIVGQGEAEARLRQRVADLGLGRAVELCGPMPQSQVFRLLRSAAALAAPCVVGADGNRDGLPTVLLEAMALGTPCVATNVTGIPEVVQNDVTGLLVPQHDPAALAGALGRLLNDASLRVRLAGQARRLVEREFDIRVNAAELREMFAGVARATSP